jgi:hypothetical protein
MVKSIGNISDVIAAYTTQKPAQLRKPDVENPAAMPDKINKVAARPPTPTVTFNSPVNETCEFPTDEPQDAGGQKLIDALRQLANQEKSQIQASASQTASSREAGLRAYQQMVGG